MAEVDKKLLDYVKANLGKGYPEESIEKTLTGAGWPPHEVREALAAAQGKKPVPPPGPGPEPVPPEEKPGPAKPALPGPEEKPKPAAPSKPVPPEQPGPPPAGKKAKAGFVASLIAGILMLIASVADLLIGFMGFPYSDLEFLYTLGILAQDELSVTAQLLTQLGQVLSVLAFALGVMVIAGAILMRKPGRAGTGGKLVLICSVLNLIALWGLGLLGILGAVIGVIGGILGIAKK